MSSENTINPSSTNRSISWNEMNPSSFLSQGSLYLVVMNTLLYPADLLRTRLQADKSDYYKNVKIREMVKSTLKEEGWRGLYKGFIPAAIGSLPGQLLYYLSYEIANQYLVELKFLKMFGTFSEPMTHATAGFLAEAGAAIAYVPSDIISQRLQVQIPVIVKNSNFRYTGTMDVIKTIWKTEGAIGFFRGYKPYLLSYGPSSAVWWCSYHSFKAPIFDSISFLETKISRTVPQKSHISQFFGGAMAGILSVVLCNPLDMARTRLQLLEIRDEKDKIILKRGFFRLIYDIYKKEGILAFFKGIKPRIYIAIPGSSLAFVGYEILKEQSLK